MEDAGAEEAGGCVAFAFFPPFFLLLFPFLPIGAGGKGAWARTGYRRGEVEFGLNHNQLISFASSDSTQVYTQGQRHVVPRYSE